MNDPFTSGMFEQSNWAPMDPFVNDYRFFGSRITATYYNKWEEEALAGKNACSLFANLHESQSGWLTGPDVIQLLSDCTTNSHKNFPVGKAKHSVMTDDDGNIIMHGLVMRYAEDKVWASTLYPWLIAAARKRDYDVKFEETTETRFVLQLCGPKTLEVLEDAAQADLHDIPFLGFKETKIAGHAVVVFRMSMVGTLGYEVHGDTPDAFDVYNRIVEAGEPYGLTKIGWVGYYTNNTEAYVQQESITFTTSARESEFYLDGLREQGMDPDIWPGPSPIMLGSCADAGDMRLYYRNPIEIGWGVSVGFDHDFPGKEALQELKANPKRLPATLIWDEEDMHAVIASYFRTDEEPFKNIAFPNPSLFQPDGIEQDYILSEDGSTIGYSSLLSYSLYSRKLMSMAVIDAAYAEEGTRVEVLWGDPGHRQMKFHATVAKAPYLDLPSNKDYPIDGIPRKYA